MMNEKITTSDPIPNSSVPMSGTTVALEPHHAANEGGNLIQVTQLIRD